MIIPFALSTFLVGPLEEFGWRGYAQDCMQASWNRVISSMNLGIVWALWHLPLFFIKDTYQYNLGAGSQSFWLFIVGIVPLTFVFTWIFNNTNRSTLAAMFFHGQFYWRTRCFVAASGALFNWFVDSGGHRYHRDMERQNSCPCRQCRIKMKCFNTLTSLVERPLAFRKQRQ
jgi:membrane protease YdiL (CAAX protease family)